MQSFNCTQCQKCNRRKTETTDFTNSKKDCNDCFVQKQERKTPNHTELKRINDHWKNPKAKEIYKRLFKC